MRHTTSRHSRSSDRILLVTPQPFYEDRGTPIAVAHTARALGQLGYTVDLLAFPFGRHIDLPRVHTVRCGNPLGLQQVPIGFSWQKCALDASLIRSFEQLLRTRHYDMVHAVEEAAYVASRICVGASRPFIYDMASSIPAELSGKPLLRSRPIQSILRSIESSVIKRAAHVICSSGLGDTVKRYAHTTPITEWRFPALMDAPDAQLVEQIRNEQKILPADKVVLYCGNFARYQGMDLLFQSFATALQKNPELLLMCVGAQDNEHRSWLKTLAPETVSRVRIVPRRPRSEIPSYLSLANCLISLRPVSQNLPLKIFEYMASGKPIIANCGPAHEPVLNSGRAFLCDATPTSIAAAMLDATRFPAQAEFVAEQARRYASSRFGWEGFITFVKNVYHDALVSSYPYSRNAAISVN